MKRKNSLKKFLFYILFVFMGYGIGYYYSPNKETSALEMQADQTDAEEFSSEALLAYMKKLKIKYPETVLSQAKLETGNFQSDIFKENHNLFGMKVAATRPTSAIGTNRGHAQYRNWKESVMDYALLQSYIIAKLPSNNNKEYRTYIQKFYSTTSDYLKRIDKTIGSGELLSSIRPEKSTSAIEIDTRSVSNNSSGVLSSFKALYNLPELLDRKTVSQSFLGSR